MLNEPLQCKRYKSIILSMMSYKYGIIYGKDYEFSDEQLSEIQSDDVYKWIALKVFGQPDPSHDDNPTNQATQLDPKSSLTSLKQ